MSHRKEPTRQQQPSTWQVICSVLAAFFGVQSEKNRHRDFKTGRASDFIFWGIVAVIVLVLLIAWVVSIVLQRAGIQ